MPLRISSHVGILSTHSTICGCCGSKIVDYPQQQEILSALPGINVMAGHIDKEKIIQKSKNIELHVKHVNTKNGPITVAYERYI